MKMKMFLIWGTLAVLLLSVQKSVQTLEEKDLAALVKSKKSTFSQCIVPNYLLGAIDTTTQIAPLFDNLGGHIFKISTNNARAQAFFNQGLSLVYGFNHAEAHRSFMEVRRLDPKSAMAYWGEAYALGPNINDPFPDNERKLKAFEASKKALELSVHASQKEKDLINALADRYSENISIETNLLNENFMHAMKKVAEKYPDDPDILTIYAASAMDTKPWDYWEKDLTPKLYIPEAKSALEKAIKINPNHPGAHHYYIHLMELPEPDMAVKSAETLLNLMPGAGHMVHMPSHIFIRVGRYKDALDANTTAIAADEDYISQCYSQGMYPLAYYPHNIHFLWSSATMLGNSKMAMDAAKKAAEKVPLGQLEPLHFLQDFAATPLLAYVRFGKWNDILTFPEPGENIIHFSMMRNYARGIAFVRKNDLAQAKEELSALEAHKNNPELANIVAVLNNNSQAIAQIAYNVVKAEILAAEGNFKEAIEVMQEGVTLEDNLMYAEPSPWHIPVRQSLGRVLLLDGQYTEAEKVYRKDLTINRQNGWSLIGLYHSLKNQGKVGEADKVLTDFNTAWQFADIKIDQSVF